MARPPKTGLDYFSHDTDASGDAKLEALEALYGLAGYAFFFKLLERIYKQPDFELDVSDAETVQILARNFHISVKKFNEMLAVAIKRKCFDCSAFSERKVLRSDGISKRASIVVEKRNEAKNRYLASKHGVSVAETPQETHPESTQSKDKDKVNNKDKVKAIRQVV